MTEQASQEYRGSTWNEVRKQLLSDPYPELPYYKITLKSFFGFFKNKLFAACKRTLNDPSDIIPWYQKLVHPLGIALMGKWKITEENPYSGYFRKGSEALVVVRSSVLLYDTRQGVPRGFAFACKLFPTTDPDERVKTADIFTIDVLAGTDLEYYTKADLTNDPPLGFNSYVNKLFWIVLVTFVSFFRANIDPIYRPLYPISDLGLEPGEDGNEPEWILIKGDPACGNVDRKDMRDELRVENYPDGKLIFDISVAPKQLTEDGERNWQKIGHIELTESVTSDSCDHRLAFNHPKLRRVL